MLYGVNKLLSTYVLLVPIYFNEKKNANLIKKL